MENNLITIEEAFKLINIAISTAKIKKLSTPYADIRPNMHSILVGRVGSLKSTILRIICDQFKTDSQFGITSATVLGTIDKQTNIPILPSIWECRNSILPIDEFNVDYFSKGSRSALGTLLSVLEYPKFEKKLGYRTNQEINEKDGDLYLKIKNGSIKINTRFTLIGNTMMPLDKKQRLQELEALKTRCLIIPYYPTMTELRHMISGDNLYKFSKFNSQPIVSITQVIYEKLIELTIQAGIKEESFVRTVGDLCRAYSVVGFNEKIFEIILKIKNRIN